MVRLCWRRVTGWLETRTCWCRRCSPRLARPSAVRSIGVSPARLTRAAEASRESWRVSGNARFGGHDPIGLAISHVSKKASAVAQWFKSPPRTPRTRKTMSWPVAQAFDCLVSARRDRRVPYHRSARGAMNGGSLRQPRQFFQSAHLLTGCRFTVRGGGSRLPNPWFCAEEKNWSAARSSPRRAHELHLVGSLGPTEYKVCRD